MPKNGLNVSLNSYDDIFPPKKRGRKNSANRYSKFPLMSCIRSKTIPLR